ncbi:MAG: efflux RND transporter periplasmic adaptor subunit, partial [Gemmatimonadaceae bacterium]|nr:efflux RND transporter periplasmic adaptor subunit [Gemmatimonadaceae bacterium]
MTTGMLNESPFGTAAPSARRRWSLVGGFALLLLAALVTVWLATRDRGGANATSATGHNHGAAPAAEASEPVMLSATEARRIGVTYATVEQGALPIEVRSVAQVTFDETKVTPIAPKIDGWVEQLYVNTTGQAVERGAPLLAIYSPMLVSAQQELILASKLARDVASGTEEARASAKELRESARRRLLLWDVPASTVDRIERTGEPEKTVVLRTPAGGVVLQKNVLAGQRVMAGDALYKVADLSAVWVEGDVFEQDLPSVRLGQSVTADFQALPGAPRSGRITYVYPTLDPETRTAKIRVALANPGLRLKPGMYATIRIAAHGSSSALTIPRSAVLSTGERNLVFVKRRDGMLEPRYVQLGAASDERVQVLGGVAAGDNHRLLGDLPRRRGVEPRRRVRRDGRHAGDGHDDAGAEAGRGAAAGREAMKRVIEWSVRNRVVVALFVLVAVVGGIIALRRTPLEALPDLSDVQVIVQADYGEQAPRIVEDQVTYPIAAEMLKVPGARTVRGYSFFGVSFVYVIFEDGTDLYWARSRVLEYLSGIKAKLPESVTPTLGPDATGLGWVYQYALEDTTGRLNLAELRSLQDWHLRYALTSVPGVSEVASVGGFEKQYQVDIDPAKLLAYGIPVTRVMSAIQNANRDVGAMVMELSEREYMVRGLGYLKSIGDIENIVVGATSGGTPVR